LETRFHSETNAVDVADRSRVHASHGGRARVGGAWLTVVAVDRRVRARRYAPTVSGAHVVVIAIGMECALTCRGIARVGPTRGRRAIYGEKDRAIHPLAAARKTEVSVLVAGDLSAGALETAELRVANPKAALGPGGAEAVVFRVLANPGCGVARIHRTRDSVIAAGARMSACAGGRVTPVARARVAVVARRGVDATGCRVARVRSARVVVVAEHRIDVVNTTLTSDTGIRRARVLVRAAVGRIAA